MLTLACVRVLIRCLTQQAKLIAMPVSHMSGCADHGRHPWGRRSVSCVPGQKSHELALDLQHHLISAAADADQAGRILAWHHRAPYLAAIEELDVAVAARRKDRGVLPRAPAG